jgi:hypothetical protein
MPLTPILGKLRQEDQVFEASLSYREDFMKAWATKQDSVKKRKEKKERERERKP